YKLVRNTTYNFNPLTNDFQTDVVDELYEIDQAAPTPKLDTPNRNLLGSDPTPETLAAYNELQATLEKILASEPDCPGDGNKDGKVDAQDLDNWRRIAHDWGLSSVYDFVASGARDGLTNHIDETVIQNNLNTTCKLAYGVY